MQLSGDVSSALSQLESVKSALALSDDAKLRDAVSEDLEMLIALLDNPAFRSCVTLQDSMRSLATQIAHHPSILPQDFDVTPAGELSLFPQGGLYEEEQRVPQLSPGYESAIGILQRARGLVEMVVGDEEAGEEEGADEEEGPPPLPSSPPPLVASEWARVEAIGLVNDGSGLGFGIIGARTSGVIVKTILPGGVADRDGRLRSGDHILRIGDEPLVETASEQVAGVLRRSGARVRLVVARPADPREALGADERAPVVPARLLSDLDALDRHLVEAGFAGLAEPRAGRDEAFLSDGDDEAGVDDEGPPETERFSVRLDKDENGLGVTIAGYVCEKEELSGIFVKSVTPGSAAARSGRVRVNDRIVAVDGASLRGRSNHRAVDALRNSGASVELGLERYLRGPKYEQLQQAIAANEARPSPGASSALNPFLDLHRPRDDDDDPSGPAIPMTHLDGSGKRFEPPPDSSDEPETSVETADRNAPGFEMPIDEEAERAVRDKWKSILGGAIEIVVGVVVKGSGGLGISLEGTVDVEEGGREVRPHHYIRSVLPEGPVGRSTELRSGDELLEVNGYRLLGMNHLEVVSILKELPARVCLVCARAASASESAAGVASGAAVVAGGGGGGALVKAKSDGSLAGAGAGAGADDDGAAPATQAGGALLGTRLRSRSLEPLTGLAMWSSEPQIIELVKGERGLGFSILDYQDPLRPAHAVIVIRSLVPGGVAQQDGRLIPGDRLLTVNDQNLENATLDQAVQALKGAPRGTVRIGVAKPLPLADCVPTSNGVVQPPSLPHNKMNTQ